MKLNKLPRVVLPLFAFLLGATLLLQGALQPTLAQGLTDEDAILSLTDITADPEAFADEEVTLEEQVGATFGRRAFALGGDDQEVLVVTADPTGFDRGLVRAGAQLRVAGEADVFEQEAFEREFGRVNPGLVQRFEGKPFLVVEPVDVEAVEAIEADIIVEPEADVVVTPEAEVEVAPEAEVVVTPEAEVEVQTEAGVQVRPEVDIEAVPEVDVEVAPQVGLEVLPNVRIAVTPHVRVRRIEVEVIPEVIVLVTPEVQVQAEPEVDVDVDDPGIDVDAEAEAEVSVGEAGVTAVTEIVADPEAFEQQEVVVEDALGRRFGRTAFTLGADDQEVLVVSTERAGFDPTLLTEGALLRAPGRVGTFDQDTFEEQTGIRVNPNVARQFAGRPYIAVDPAELEATGEEVGLGADTDALEDVGAEGLGEGLEDATGVTENEEDPLDYVDSLFDDNE